MPLEALSMFGKFCILYTVRDKQLKVLSVLNLPPRSKYGYMICDFCLWFFPFFIFKGRDFSHDETLDVPTQVELLIKQATSHENLCQCYIGW